MDLSNKLTNMNFLYKNCIFIGIYIERNKISGGLKGKFDTLAKERGIEIKLEDQIVVS